MIKKISSFVLISSDKAVRPTNIMGASKRLSNFVYREFIITQEVSRRIFNSTFWKCSRILWLVIPKFKRQIIEGGPATLTHKTHKIFYDYKGQLN